MGNIVFYFSGTGNCLKVAKTIAKELGSSEIVSMGKPGKYTLSKQYDSIGFIYPDYYWGLPRKVIEFIENADFGNNKKTYYYSIATYGGDLGNAVLQIQELLRKKHGIKLNNGQKLRMFANYVINYDMKKDVDRITQKSNENLIPIINSIKSRENNSVSKITKILGFVNLWFVKTVSDKDKNFTVSNACTGCGICKEVCPVKNIELINNKPGFNHNCEQCLACVHYCPPKAINYKNKTQNRGRYNHPDISYKELAEYADCKAIR